MSSLFWKRFVAEYLPGIFEGIKWYDPVEPLREGDEFAIVSADIPGNS